MKRSFSHKTHLFSHFPDVVILTLGCVVYLTILRLASSEKILMYVTSVAFASFYILWGIFTQARRKTLHITSVLEYLCIGFLMLILLQFFLIP